MINYFSLKNKIGLKDNVNDKQDPEIINKIKNKYHECEDNNYCYDKKDIHLVYISDTDLIYTELNNLK